MNEISVKFKRQIEILGIAIDNKECLTTNDLAQNYAVERLTIKRDLQELRLHGIDIHSEGKKGVRLSNKIDASRIQGLLSSYLTLSTVGSSIDKASLLLTKKSGIESLNIVVAIQMAIENTELIQIDYESDRGQERIKYTIGPLQIFQAGELWRFLALHDDTIKQLLLTKILSVKLTGEQFKRPEEQKIADIFKHSFLIWTGGEKHIVRLRLAKSVARRLLSRQLISFETIGQNRDGSIDVEGVVNSLDEIAAWIVAQKGDVITLRPTVLTNKIRKIGQSILKSHQLVLNSVNVRY